MGVSLQVMNLQVLLTLQLVNKLASNCIIIIEHIIFFQINLLLLYMRPIVVGTANWNCLVKLPMEIKYPGDRSNYGNQLQFQTYINEQAELKGLGLNSLRVSFQPAQTVIFNCAPRMKDDWPWG